MSDDNKANRITVLAKDFSPAAMEYHRREMGKRGYNLAGPIVQHSFMLLDGPGEPSPILDGELYYAATFEKKKSGS